MLLSRLKFLVTTKPSSKINTPTGIPPDVWMLLQIGDLLEMVKDKRNQKEEPEEKLALAVENTIKKHALSNGHITDSLVSNILKIKALALHLSSKLILKSLSK